MIWFCSAPVLISLVLISVTRTSSKQKKKQRGIHYYGTPRYPELQDLNTASAVAPLCTCTPPLSLCAPQVGVLVEAGYSQHACLMPAALRLADGCRSCLDLSQTRQRDLLFSQNSQHWKRVMRWTHEFSPPRHEVTIPLHEKAVDKSRQPCWPAIGPRGRSSAQDRDQDIAESCRQVFQSQAQKRKKERKKEDEKRLIKMPTPPSTALRLRPSRTRAPRQPTGGLSYPPSGVTVLHDRNFLSAEISTLAAITALPSSTSTRVVTHVPFSDMAYYRVTPVLHSTDRPQERRGCPRQADARSRSGDRGTERTEPYLRTVHAKMCEEGQSSSAGQVPASYQHPFRACMITRRPLPPPFFPSARNPGAELRRKTECIHTYIQLRCTRMAGMISRR